MEKEKCILFLERETVSPDGLSLEPVEACGDVRYLDGGTAEEQLLAAREADYLVINKTKITREFLAGCPDLQCIFLLATGYNNVDIAAAHEFGVGVCNVPDYSTDAVAQLTFAFLLNFATNLPRYDASVKAGRWVSCGAYTYHDWPVVELRGKTIGIVGYGNIGKRVGKIAEAFGMRILAHTRTVPPEGAAPMVRFCSLRELLEESDFVTLHCPMTEQTARMIRRETLSWMKPTAYLINTARGGLVDEQDLTDALNEGRIAGAGIDVLDPEPMRADCPYLLAKNLLITPHKAWAAREARERLIGEVAENMKAFASGRLRNRVDV